MQTLKNIQGAKTILHHGTTAFQTSVINSIYLITFSIPICVSQSIKSVFT